MHFSVFPTKVQKLLKTFGKQDFYYTTTIHYIQTDRATQDLVVGWGKQNKNKLKLLVTNRIQLLEQKQETKLLLDGKSQIFVFLLLDYKSW